MTQDEIFMQRAMELAATGLGRVAPNPCVGCVIVAGGKIIGEGWHQVYGGPHAEVNAVNAVEDQSLLQTATIYVNLEPCAHHGKTPPCADLLIRHQIKRVVIANVDTNPLVGGKGIQKLRSAGIEVITGVMEHGGRELNRRFFTFIEKQRPYIILKWAQTADRFIAGTTTDPKWISNIYSRQQVHKWRSEEASILAGTTTILEDDPELSVREWTGNSPVRIVIDRFLRLPLSLKVFDGKQKTICYNLVRDEDRENLTFVKIPEINFLEMLLADLYKRKIQSLLVEGGQQTHGLFIQKQLWDEARIFSSANSFGAGVKAPEISGRLVEKYNVNGDQLEIFKPFKI